MSSSDLWRRQRELLNTLSNANERAIFMAHKDLVARGVLPACVNCDYWSDDNALTHTSSPKETCMKYNMRPPAKVIAVGCEAHVPDIPF